MSTYEQTVTKTAEWVRGRPEIPGYGVPTKTSGMLDWPEVASRLAAAKIYWICTASGSGVPHAVPVWGVYAGETIYFGGGPRTSRNLDGNPRVTIHLESGDEVVIAEGVAGVLREPDAALSQTIDDQCAAKYDWRPSTEGDAAVGEGWRTLTPAKVIAWTSFPANATRWTRTPVAESPK